MNGVSIAINDLADKDKEDPNLLVQEKFGLPDYSKTIAPNGEFNLYKVSRSSRI